MHGVRISKGDKHANWYRLVPTSTNSALDQKQHVPTPCRSFPCSDPSRRLPCVFRFQPTALSSLARFLE
ncbi:hypothetical protein I7I50_09779 [Histoplasma capsulatum G186AR]|uniref:Uncharacterized protein n=1 Tax=Ajellomyces capsulatus TaxID=5037 RepID=A0A8H7YYF2_AJECA|nr:hypothetical protein I7I52_10904 [Histoplasma capsulatum]QSS68719.1 hypothetical protein I7I50_09779 [Histoplasma capsulatum G186AR]